MRDFDSNEGRIFIKGYYDKSGINPNYDQIVVDLYRNNSLFDRKKDKLKYSNNLANFSFNMKIIAERVNYRIEISGKKGKDKTLLKSVNSVVAGDTYIIQGQSNAEAEMAIGGGSSDENINKFIRVYASGTKHENALLSDDKWYYGQGDGDSESAGNTGQWGLKLANMMLKETGYPIAIFNGATGGEAIDFFQKDYHNDGSEVDPKTNNYERLRLRLEKNNLEDAVRAIFWSQGERVGQYDNYYAQFMKLKNSWISDYSKIEKFYIFQTDNNCTDALEKTMIIKEAQRQLAFDNPEISIMTTAALKHSEDNCHFNYIDGYESFAKRIYNLVVSDIYGGINETDLGPPMIIDAYISNQKNIIIETDASSLSMESPAAIDFFDLESSNGAKIESIEVMNGNIILELNQFPGMDAFISYLGPNSDITGNFIMNSNRIELVSFKGFKLRSGTLDIEDL